MGVEILRALRLGVINLFGIAVPGFLIIFIFFSGLILPTTGIILMCSQGNWNNIMVAWESNKYLIIFVVVVLSYVAGYILRLSSPDELDKVSASQVYKSLNESEKILWPYQMDSKDKFPYFHFKKYLKARSLDHLLYLVNWGPDPDDNAGKQHQESENTKRSKTAIHLMKLDILINCPELAAIVESNEAHIRLMSGTWIVIRTTAYIVIGGLIMSIIGVIIYSNQSLHIIMGISDASLKQSSSLSYFLICILLEISMLGAMGWAKYKIENLFHYRRVSELVYIVQSAHLAREIKMEKNKNINCTG